MKKTPWVCAHLKTWAPFFCQFHTSKFYLFGTAKYFYISIYLLFLHSSNFFNGWSTYIFSSYASL